MFDPGDSWSAAKAVHDGGIVGGHWRSRRSGWAQEANPFPSTVSPSPKALRFPAASEYRFSCSCSHRPAEIAAGRAMVTGARRMGGKAMPESAIQELKDAFRGTHEKALQAVAELSALQVPGGLGRQPHQWAFTSGAWPAGRTSSSKWFAALAARSGIARPSRGSGACRSRPGAWRGRLPPWASTRLRSPAWRPLSRR